MIELQPDDTLLVYMPYMLNLGLTIGKIVDPQIDLDQIT